jgi:hypothetical protein
MGKYISIVMKEVDPYFLSDHTLDSTYKKLKECQLFYLCMFKEFCFDGLQNKHQG